MACEIIFSALGTKGDIYPLIGIGAALVKRGYRVKFLANDVFGTMIGDVGIEFVSIGTRIEYANFHSDARIWSATENPVEIGYPEYYGPATQRSFEYVMQLCKRRSDLFVVTLDVHNGARMAADALGLPCGIFALSPNIFPSAYAPAAPLCWRAPKSIPRCLYSTYFKFVWWLADWQETPVYVTALRKKLHIKTKNYKATYNYCKEKFVIALFPEWFGMPQNDWPDKVQLVGFPFFSEIDIESRLIVDEFVVSMGSPLVFAPGTGVTDAADLFIEGRLVCEALKIPGIFLGGGANKDVFSNSPFCLHVPYVDLQFLLPRSKAIVHHGGIGTTAQAIRAGIPQLIRPLTFDQPDNAERVRQLNLGGYVSRKNFTAESIAPILLSLIEEAELNTQLKIYKKEVIDSDAIASCVSIIENALMRVGN